MRDRGQFGIALESLDVMRREDLKARLFGTDETGRALVQAVLSWFRPYNERLLSNPVRTHKPENVTTC